MFSQEKSTVLLYQIMKNESIFIMPKENPQTQTKTQQKPKPAPAKQQIGSETSLLELASNSLDMTMALGVAKQASRLKNVQLFVVYNAMGMVRMPTNKMMIGFQHIPKPNMDTHNKGKSMTTHSDYGYTESETYEFTHTQNSVIGRLSLYMQIVGGLIVAWGAFGVFIGSGFGYFLSAILFVIGLCSWRAGVAFKKIVKSEGSDISHLMEALTNIRNVYLAQVVICGLLFAFMLFAVGIVLFVD